MVNSKKSTKNFSVAIVTVLFLAIAITCMCIGYKNEVLNWLSTVGLCLLFILIPVLIYAGYQYISKKIKEM